jgi:hypothetical protein
MSWDIKANITGDDKELKAKLKSAEEEVKKTSENMAKNFQNAMGGDFLKKILTSGLGAIGLGIVADYAGELADSFKERIKTVKLGTLRTGLDADTFQRVANLSEATDMPADSFARVMDHIAEQQQKVKEGGEEGAKALERFGKVGVSAADAQRKSYQELSLQIFRYMQNVELTGEKIAALKEIGGRTAPELIPAMKIGLDSATAERGIIDDKDLKAAAEAKKAMAETAAYWADVKNNAGSFFASMFDAAKMVPQLVATYFNPTDEQKAAAGLAGSSESMGAIAQSDPERYKEIVRKEMEQKDKAAAIAQKDEKRRKEQMEDSQRDEDARRESESRRKAAEKSIPALEDKFDEARKKARLSRMSPSQQKAEMEKELKEEGKLRDEAQSKFLMTQSPEAKEEYMKHGIKAFGLQEQLARLEKQGTDMTPTQDSLARIGGGFVAPDQSVPRKLDDMIATLKNIESEIKNGNAENSWP